jgi:asparagine synthase (glutamine-hydrolysing)
MCGIFCYLGGNYRLVSLVSYFRKLRHRGPDSSNILKITDDLVFGFQRLMINGLDVGSNQPMVSDSNNWLICNGEIYNYRLLMEENNFVYKSNSDCEIILHMYERYGIDETCKRLDGVFAFILYDSFQGKVYAARDRYGIRSMYYGKTNNITDMFFASEMKCLTMCDHIEQFPAGKWWCSDMNSKFVEYYKYDWDINYITCIPENNNSVDTDAIMGSIYNNISYLLENAIKKRMMSDRKICTLLSGGLDSTLVSALLCKQFSDPSELNTYSIGLEGSENCADIYYSRMAAKYLGTTHHEVIVSETDFLAAIEKTIIQIESYCTTTVRASVGNYLISLYIRDFDRDLNNSLVRKSNKNDLNKYDGIANNFNRNVIVFVGDFADEIWGSYQGMRAAMSGDDFNRENIKLVRDCHYFDLLRSDKSISGASLEARVPFADSDLVDYVMSIDPSLKMFSGDKLEKGLMRAVYKNTTLLPDDLLYRRKVAFSDGVSSMERSWFDIIKEYVDIIIPNNEFEERCNKYTHNRPYDKESLYYREIFEKYYHGHANTIPYYWKHAFTTNVDPSARLLDSYQE